MRRPLLIACALTIGPPPSARADDAHGVDDPRFSLSLRAGILQTDDDAFDATWYRPAILEGSGWILRSPRRWLGGLQLYGMAGLESIDVAYREHPSSYQESLVGIHRADIRVRRGLALGAGARASLYDGGRLRLSAFADLAEPLRASEVEVDALLIDLEGLKIDVAKAVREHASVSYRGRTLRLGLTAAAGFRARGLRWVPYLTFGWLRYDATIAFETNDRLKTALAAFGVDASVLSERAIVESNVFFAPGIRIDLSRSWSLETQALIGRYDGTWVAAGAIGAAWRFGP